MIMWYNLLTYEVSFYLMREYAKEIVYQTKIQLKYDQKFAFIVKI